MPVAVEEVALEGGSAGLLVVTVALRLVLVIPETYPVESFEQKL